MPIFELKPVDGGNLVLLPEGETVLGRGPLFGVNDKRVSRNHGLLENADGKLRIKPTHLNPCFVQSSLESPPQPLQKGQWYTLGPGDLLSLLPGKHVYCVVAKETEEEAKEEEEEEVPKEEDESTIRNSQNLHDDEKGESDGEGVVSGEAKTSCSAPPSANEEPDGSTLPYRAGVSVSQQSTLEASLERRGSEERPLGSATGDLVSGAGVAEREDVVGDEAAAAAPQRTRTLPAWMMAGSSGEASAPNTPKGAGKRGPAKATATTPKPKPKPKAAAVSTPKRGRARVVSSEEDEEAREREEEEEEVVQLPKRRRKRVKSSEEEEDEEEEMKAAAGPPRLVKPARQSTPVRDEMSDESDGMEVGQAMEDEEQDEVQKRPRGRAPGATSSSVTSTGSTDRKRNDNDDDDNKPSSQNGHGASQAASKAKSKETTAGGASVKKATRRTPCPYGSSCYRKNPVHFQESSHPGDSDYEEGDEEEEKEVDEEDDDRPECPYGTDCYRKNPLHKKEYKHTRPPARTSASRQDDGDEDEDAYDDSFIDDDSEGDVAEDSDYVPEDSGDSGKEDVKRLQKEAKAFLRRKK
ncbi:aprataxin and PNK-like factor isoform X2 [Sardina pilchardus]|uniref:aprataxin and PNK-like factor isoform X2 n=1 Tax=Sardina pilchardus TaxID=27697 RepID=UPI002E0D80BA